MQLSETLARYHAQGGDHPRYRWWEHCFGYFHNARRAGVLANPAQAALHLAFYLASWGMYRGSSFLLQYSHTVHIPLVVALVDERFEPLWEADVGSDGADERWIGDILELASLIRRTYEPFARDIPAKPPTDTLVTKILLGTLGCVPACDQLFLKGIKGQITYSSLDERFLRSVLRYCEVHRDALRVEQERLERRSGIRHPLMKMVDMYFWQLGLERQIAMREQVTVAQVAAGPQRDSR